MRQIQVQDAKKNPSINSTVTRNMDIMEKPVGNVYAAVNIISKRANQVSVILKEELNKKLEEFASYTDNLEEVFENREQIEISRYYEKMPKGTLIAIQEFLDGRVYFRNTADDEQEVEKA